MPKTHTPRQNHIVIDNRFRRASTGRYGDRLVEHLQNIDHVHRYTILVAPDDPWLPRSANFHALPCPFPQFSLNPLHQIQFTLLLTSLKPDLVHFLMTQQPVPYFGRIVTTTHDLTMFHFVRRGTTPLPVYWFKMGLYRFLVRWSHFKSKRIIVPTKFVATDVAAYQPSIKNKLVVTYESSEPPLKTAAKRPKLVGEHDQFIMYLGNAFPHKNLLKLIEAFDILHAQRPDLKLVLVGKKEKHYIELEQQIKQNHAGAKNIIITGFLPDDEAKWLYQHTLCYVFPSLSEGFGLPAMEAMAHGAPVASSNASCLPEVYGPAAHYFNAEDPADMAKKIAQVLDDKNLREKLIKNGQQQLKKYSWHKMAEETLIVYKAALDEE
ncbi:MAG TPA: glycosyltransferase family 1 protein [Nevskiaceae bacterium]|nr:glycosyltransferase family 1 protein [Nevskiaceae bacterium]